MKHRNIHIFLVSFLISAFLGIGLNTSSASLENFVFWYEMSKNPSNFTASILQDNHEKIREQKPKIRKDAAEFSTDAKAVFSLFINPQGKTKVLFDKNGEDSLPLASIAKLMSALVVLEHYPQDQEILITKEAVSKEENFGNFKPGEVLQVKELLKSMLLESSNDAAAALSGLIGEDLFLHLMNTYAARLDLQHSSFRDIAGVDLEQGDPNTMSAKDLTRLTAYLMDTHPVIFEILSQKQLDLRFPDEELHHTMRNTNELVHSSSFPLEILGGKTGWTPLSEGCLLLITESPNNSGYLIHVILGSSDRFGEMRRLIDWIIASYDF